MAKAVAKKKWFKIVAPKLFREKVIGETTSFDPKTIMGKSMKVNMFTLTDNIKKQNTEVNLVVDNVDTDKATTSIVGLKILPTSIKRLVRKGRSRLDVIVKGITKDEKVVTVKLLLITRNVIQGGVSTALRHAARAFTHKKIASSSLAGLTEIIATTNLQKEMKGSLAKIYPMRICEVRVFKFERFIKSVDLRKIKAQLSGMPQEVKEESSEESQAEEQKGEQAEETQAEAKEEPVEEPKEAQPEEKVEEPKEEVQAEEPKEDNS
ncbi:hypothetical protein GOV09_01195 [Candidatus Woesearchaeota archaeon]|nr:hypothetical protein [Candidatus Woesearchaeota archaeon]